MSALAIVPVANLDAANEALADAGFGADNFSVPAYTAGVVTHAALHMWPDPAFLEVLETLDGVVLDLDDGDPRSRIQALVEAQGAMLMDGRD